MYKFLLLFLVNLTINVTQIYAQDCLDFYKQCSAYTGKVYQYHENTRSFLLTNNDSIEVTFDALKGINYNINICSDEFSLPLHFLIQNDKKQVMYDNKDDNYSNEFEFSVNKYQRLYVVVNIDHECINNVSSCEGCVGVLIKKTVKERTGF